MSLPCGPARKVRESVKKGLTRCQSLPIFENVITKREKAGGGRGRGPCRASHRGEAKGRRLQGASQKNPTALVGEGAVSDNVCSDDFRTVIRFGKSPKLPKPENARLNAPLKFAILQSGQSQMAIARACGIHFTKLSLIVRGWRLPSASERARIADCLGRNEADLFPEKVA